MADKGRTNKDKRTKQLTIRRDSSEGVQCTSEHCA